MHSGTQGQHRKKNTMLILTANNTEASSQADREKLREFAAALQDAKRRTGNWLLCRLASVEVEWWLMERNTTAKLMVKVPPPKTKKKKVTYVRKKCTVLLPYLYVWTLIRVGRRFEMYNNNKKKKCTEYTVVSYAQLQPDAPVVCTQEKTW